MQERFVVHITDVLAVSMMLGITAQVKEAGIAWDKGEKKSKDRPAREGLPPPQLLEMSRLPAAAVAVVHTGAENTKAGAGLAVCCLELVALGARAGGGRGETSLGSLFWGRPGCGGP